MKEELFWFLMVGLIAIGFFLFLFLLLIFGDYVNSKSFGLPKIVSLSKRLRFRR